MPLHCSGFDPELTTGGTMALEAFDAMARTIPHGRNRPWRGKNDPLSFTGDGTLHANRGQQGLVSMRELPEHEIEHLAQELDSVTQYLSVDGSGGD